MGLKEKAENLKKKLKKKSIQIPKGPTPIGSQSDSTEHSETNSFGTIAALVIGAIGIILLKGRKS